MINILELKVMLESILDKPTDRRIEEVTKYVEFLEESEVDYLEWFKKHTDPNNIREYNPLEINDKFILNLLMDINLTYPTTAIMPSYFIFVGIGCFNYLNQTLGEFFKKYHKPNHPIPDSTCYRGLIGAETLIFHLPHLDSRERCKENVEETGLPKMSYTGFIIPCKLENPNPPYGHDETGVKWLKYALSQNPDPKHCGLLYV